jgi:hypothetical protein
MVPWSRCDVVRVEGAEEEVEGLDAIPMRDRVEENLNEAEDGVEKEARRRKVVEAWVDPGWWE